MYYTTKSAYRETYDAQSQINTWDIMKILFWTVKLLIKVKRKGCLLRFGVKRRNWLAQGDLNSSKRPHNNCKKFNENHLKRASMWGNTSSQIQLNSKREYTTIINNY
jgi:hypothetical protein